MTDRIKQFFCPNAESETPSVSPEKSSVRSRSSYTIQSHHCSLTKSSKSSFLQKDLSTDSDREEMKTMSSTLGDISQTDYSSTPLSDSSIQSMSMDHDLLDQPFAETSPAPTGFATSLLSKIRHQTTNLPSNTTNDPSTSIANLNEKAKWGEPVLPYVDCDVAMRIDSKVSDEVMKYLIHNLADAGLIIKEEKGHSGDYYLSITTDVEHFLKGAETLHLPKRVHPDKGDGCKEFNICDIGSFCPRQTTDGFLVAAERQLIVYNIIIKMRTKETTSVSGIEINENESIVSKLLIKGIVKQIYPLHQPTKQNVLNRLWVWNFAGQQPLNLIRQYFGEEIALYFAWLGFYTCVLVIPMLIGLVINFTYDDDDVESADWCFTFYAFFNVIWPSVFLELWKRRSSELAWQWGTLNKQIEHTETERPEFYGNIGENPITSECEVQYAPHKRQIKQAISLVINVFCLFIVLISMLAVFKYDDYIQVMVTTGSFPDFVPSILKDFVKFTPKIVLPITVGILDALYSNIAVSLNDWENYRHQRTYENWLVLKLIMFKFVNSFLALFYIAFYLRDFDKLQEMLAALLITKQIVGNFGEVLGPTVTSWVKVYLLQRSIDKKDSSSDELSQVEKESEKPQYECTFDDYLEMFIQMGYVILFSAAYPLAGVWAFLNNVVEIRSDAFKLVNGIQRPFIKRVADIGFWQDAFEVLSVVSIIVNCALIGVRGQIGRWFPQFGVVESMLFIIFLEHMFLAMKYIITRAIPDVPHWVEIEHAKEHYRRVQAHQVLENMLRSGNIKSKLKQKATEAKERLGDENWTDGQKDKSI